MKKLSLALLAAAVAFAPMAASADSLAVTGAAAQDGAFGLEVTHDNSSAAYVQDNTPNEMDVFRAEWMFNQAAWNSNGSSVRQAIFRLISQNPNPNNFTCSGSGFVTLVDVFVYNIFNGTLPFSTTFGAGRGCAFAGVGNLIRIDDSGADVNNDGWVRMCLELTIGATGSYRFGVTDDTGTCAAATYESIVRDNAGMSVEQARLGAPQTNGFGANETATFYFDQYSSFRSTAAF